MTRGIFVTGTDTGVGKTVVAAALLRGVVAEGFRAVGMKPVAAGADETEEADDAVPADTRALIAAGNVDAPLGDVGPYVFAPPIAPELAARAEAIVVEGAGGALVPLSRATDMLDIPARLHLPVLLVVGIRLGCINHALLTALAIRARGLAFAGWVANRIDRDMLEGNASVAALTERLRAPLCADIAWSDDAARAPIFPRAAVRALGFAPRH